jgi:hypothetical protein
MNPENIGAPQRHAAAGIPDLAGTHLTYRGTMPPPQAERQYR